MFYPISNSTWDLYAGAMPFPCGAAPLYAEGTDCQGHWDAVISPESMEIHVGDATYAIQLHNATAVGAKHWGAAFITALTNMGGAAAAAETMGFQRMD